VILGAVVLLAGCVQSTGFRDKGAPIYSSTRFEAARFAGDWIFREAVPADGPLSVTVSGVTPQGFLWDESGRGATGAYQRKVDARLTGTGRFTLDGREVWVLWVDDGFRTAALGTPDGSFGWILDRNAAGGGDRITAAREILDFNGYDVSKLTKVNG